mgnify:FL=1
MILSIPIHTFDDKYVFFSDVTKNIVISDSIFMRIYYSTDLFTMNGLFLSFPLEIYNVEKSYNKVKCFFKINNNIDTLNTIKNIEYTIINKLNIERKRPVYAITKQLQEEYIKLYDINIIDRGSTSNIICKISGIWDDGSNFGLTYKFMT